MISKPHRARLPSSSRMHYHTPVAGHARITAAQHLIWGDSLLQIRHTRLVPGRWTRSFAGIPSPLLIWGSCMAGLIENLTVDVYGDKVPLRSLGAISVRDAQTLLVSPWDKGVCPSHFILPRSRAWLSSYQWRD